MKVKSCKPLVSAIIVGEKKLRQQVLSLLRAQLVKQLIMTDSTAEPRPSQRASWSSLWKLNCGRPDGSFLLTVLFLQTAPLNDRHYI